MPGILRQNAWDTARRPCDVGLGTLECVGQPAILRRTLCQNVWDIEPRSLGRRPRAAGHVPECLGHAARMSHCQNAQGGPSECVGHYAGIHGTLPECQGQPPDALDTPPECLGHRPRAVGRGGGGGGAPGTLGAAARRQRRWQVVPTSNWLSSSRLSRPASSRRIRRAVRGAAFATVSEEFRGSLEAPWDSSSPRRRTRVTSPPMGRGRIQIRRSKLRGKGIAA